VFSQSALRPPLLVQTRRGGRGHRPVNTVVRPVVALSDKPSLPPDRASCSSA